MKTPRKPAVREKQRRKRLTHETHAMQAIKELNRLGLVVLDPIDALIAANWLPESGLVHGRIMAQLKAIEQSK